MTTWWDFFWDVASNTLATVIGVALGVPVALWIERRVQSGADAAEKALRKQDEAVAAERLRVRRLNLVALLTVCLTDNLSAIEYSEGEVGADRPVHWTAIDRQTWEVLKPEVTELIDDGALVALLVRFFAILDDFVAMLSRRSQSAPGTQGFTGMRDALLTLGPHLRNHGRAISEQLRLVAIASQPAKPK